MYGIRWSRCIGFCHLTLVVLKMRKQLEIKLAVCLALNSQPQSLGSFLGNARKMSAGYYVNHRYDHSMSSDHLVDPRWADYYELSFECIIAWFFLGIVTISRGPSESQSTSVTYLILLCFFFSWCYERSKKHGISIRECSDSVKAHYAYLVFSYSVLTSHIMLHFGPTLLLSTPVLLFFSFLFHEWGI